RRRRTAPIPCGRAGQRTPSARRARAGWPPSRRARPPGRRRRAGASRSSPCASSQLLLHVLDDVAAAADLLPALAQVAHDDRVVGGLLVADDDRLTPLRAGGGAELRPQRTLVETPNEAGLDLEAHTERRQTFGHACEVRLARRAEVVEHARGAIGHDLALGALAVEDAQGVLVHARLVLVAQ